MTAVAAPEVTPDPEPVSDPKSAATLGSQENMFSPLKLPQVYTLLAASIISFFNMPAGIDPVTKGAAALGVGLVMASLGAGVSHTLSEFSKFLPGKIKQNAAGPALAGSAIFASICTLGMLYNKQPHADILLTALKTGAIMGAVTGGAFSIFAPEALKKHAVNVAASAFGAAAVLAGGFAGYQLMQKPMENVAAHAGTAPVADSFAQGFQRQWLPPLKP